MFKNLHPLGTVNTILIVEDQPANGRLLCKLLTRRGHRVLTALDGEEALEVVKRERPALVISDVLMPRMDGFELVRQMRADPLIAEIKVIFYTGSFIEAESIALAKAGGVSHVISKVAEPAQIYAVIDEVLGTGPPGESSKVDGTFEQRHLRLVTDKLSEKVRELEKLTEELEQRVSARTSELAAANARSLELLKMKSEVLAIVTHDLRSPLSSILLGAQILVTQGGRVKAPERKAILEQIATCAGQQIRFVNDLLALARGDGTQARREPSEVKLSEVAWDVIRSISLDAGAKKLSIEVFAPVDDVAIIGDRSKISQIFANLLTNSVKFTSEGGEIRVVIEHEPSGACVKVSDTGVGIPAEQLPYLFETFKAPQTVGTAGETGTGLGLSIVCQALQQQGGAIEVHSQPGAGTTFTLHLPFRSAPAAQHRISHHRSARRGAKARSSSSPSHSVRAESLQA